MEFLELRQFHNYQRLTGEIERNFNMYEAREIRKRIVGKSDETKDGRKTEMKKSKSKETSPVSKKSIAEKATNKKSPDISKPVHLEMQRVSAAKWWGALLLVTALSVSTRLYKIEFPSQICWDETHFGKMGSYYINRTFFHDVHPPLGKMLIGMAGVLTGYEGNFSFSKPGVSYAESNIKYVGMRCFCALLGSSLVPMSFVGVWELSKTLTAAFLAALLLVFDVGFITISQYILLDTPLMFFIGLAAMATTKFFSYRNRPFTLQWWLWLIISGLGLGGAMGVKFVGLFIVLTVGIATVTDLWNLYGDLGLSMFDVLKHFVARTVCLILVPAALYLFFFVIHYEILIYSGPGDGFYSSWFQSTLKNNTLHNASMPEDVMYGSVVTIKQYRTGGAYLHSHWHLYPEGVGAKQQQVTTYSHKDHNNHFIVKRFDRSPGEGEKPVPLKHGDIIRLEHVPTQRNLHSHPIPAPITKRHHQITCYGANGTGDSNDMWRIEVDNGYEGQPVKALQTVFRIVHHNMGCAVFSHNKQLPKWGWEQMEVTCNPSKWDNGNRWTVEMIMDDRLSNVSFVKYRPGFLSKLVESHAVMFQSNSGLKPKEDEDTSRPWQWPITYKGQPFCGPVPRVVLLGNPVLWWLNCVAIGYFWLVFFYHSLKTKRGYEESKVTIARRQSALQTCNFLLLAWVLHYAPFWLMSRVLYFHHYFPAAIFSFMTTGVLLEYFIYSISSFSKRPAVETSVYNALLAAAVGGIIYSFYLFHPLSYGVTGAKSNDPAGVMYGLKWLNTWDF